MYNFRVYFYDIVKSYYKQDDINNEPNCNGSFGRQKSGLS